MKKAIILIFILVFITSEALGQSSDPLEKETLRGIPGMYVYIRISENIPSLEQDGLTKQQIQTDVEAKLKKPGIRVLTSDEVKELKSKPTLQIELISIKNDALTKLLNESTYSFSIQVEFKQTVTLKSSPGKIFLATTWSDSMAGVTAKRTLGTIREGISESVDKFINDYLAVNPIR